MHASTRHRLLWPGDARRWLLLLISTLISILLALFLAAPIARADSPFNDITQPRPQGGGAGAAGERLSSDAPALPAMLPGSASSSAPSAGSARPGGSYRQGRPASTCTSAWILA